CGFGPQPAGTGIAVDDGIAPYRLVGPISLCVGSTRVVSSARVSTQGTGTCVPEAREPYLCGEGVGVCPGRETCVCGLCTTVICRDTSECPTGLSCVSSRCTQRCSGDGDCATGEVCDRGGCTLPCESDDGCAFGETCSMRTGLCGVSRCGGGGPACGGGERCEAQQTVGDVSEPFVIAQGATTVLYYSSVGDDGTSVIYRAESTDGVLFTSVPTEPVLRADDAGGARAPAIDILDDGTIDVFFEAGDGREIRIARASDGITFSEPVPVLQPAAPWEQGHIASPAAVRIENELLLFYAGGRGAGIGLARGYDTGALERADAPVVGPESLLDDPFWRGIDRVGSPYVTIHTSALGERSLRLFVTARGAEGSSTVGAGMAAPPPLNESIGVMVSPVPPAGGAPTFERWPFNPIFARVAELGGYRSEREPAVIDLGRQHRMYLVGADVTGTEVEGILLAVNPVEQRR
ncbi:MAG: exo-alpha-sialidase, partial [Deltaproteobacteria bacterium]|nr:exo-alpha-sialidase [Deltaproteobacteria bacterium]